MPQNVTKRTDFMFKTGAIKIKPESRKDLFCCNAHGLGGA